MRVRGNVEAERRELDARLALIVPGGISDIHSLDQHRAAGLHAFRAASLIGVAVGGLALLLTVSGVYGVLACLVTQRTREIGVRMALGATAGVVRPLILNQLLRMAATGVAIGVALALGSIPAAGLSRRLHARVRRPSLWRRRAARSRRGAGRRIRPLTQGRARRSDPDASLRLTSRAQWAVRVIPGRLLNQ